MSTHPDIATALDAGETLLWKGAPQPGRRVPVRATIYALAFGAMTAVLLLFSWYLAIWQGDLPGLRLIVLALLATAALFTFLALRLTLLDRRRARARDKSTAYAITDRRALILAGPYRTEVPLGPGVAVTRFDDTVTITDGTTKLRFERLDDARTAQDILATRIEGKT